MPDTPRRDFLRTTGMAAAGALAAGVFPASGSGSPTGSVGGAGGAGMSGRAAAKHPPVVPTPLRAGQERTTRRPPAGERAFTSEAVERTIAETKERLADPEMAWLFENCFPNTLDTTVRHRVVDGRPDTFVITGDIEAMWLRDSSAQVWPYVPLAAGDEALRTLLAGVINRQTDCIHIDPYANAFNFGPTGSQWSEDLTDMKPELHERKWEVDSLCYPIRLAWGYWKATGDTSPFDERWRAAMGLVLRTFREQQRKDGPGPYKFQRVTGWQTDTVAGAGYGNPVRPVGLIVSIFRPSDDATTFPFLVPSNHFAVVSLRRLAEMTEALGDAAFARECRSLASEVEAALAAHAVVEHPVLGDVWAYEVDGFGNRHHMDDANVPSLLALPYLEACARDDPLYLRTRAAVLSAEHDPWFFEGTAAEGVGGPHVGLDMIWPMGIIMRAFTSTSDDEVARCLEWLKTTHGGTGFMHESFHKDDPSRWTRDWFAWANTLFGELVLTALDERPGLLEG